MPAPWEGEEPVTGGEPVAPREVEPVSVAPEPVAAGEEVVSERTEVSKTFATGEAGVFETRVFGEPVHVRAEAVEAKGAAADGEGDAEEGPGEWVEIDTTLVEDDEGRLVPAVAEGSTSIATDSGESSLVRVDLGDGAFVAWGLQVPQGEAGLVADVESAIEVMADPEDVPGEVDGDTVTFEEVAPGVDVQVASTPSGVKEDLVLAGPGAPVVYDFPLTVSGVEAVATGGGVQFLDEAGELVGAIPAGFMVDSADVFSAGVDMTLIEGDADALTLRVDLDQEWLADPERVFPVMVDPSVSLAGVDDTMVLSNQLGRDLSGFTFMRVGRNSAGAIGRGFLQFDTSDLDGKTINYANLNLFNYASSSCTPSELSVHQVTEAWSGPQTSWPGPSWGKKVGGVSAANGAAGCPADWVRVEVSQVVRDWTGGQAENYGLSLHATESSTAGNKEFRTSEASADRPYLAVNWREPLLGVLDYYTLNSEDLTDRVQVHNNVANGNVVLQASDLSLPGVNGLGVDISRFYNSREDTANTRRGMTGTGWTMSAGQDVRLSVNGYDRSATFEGPTGYTMVIPWNRTTGQYERPVGLNATLTHVGSSVSDHRYELEFHETGLTYKFTGSPKLSAIADKSGNQVVMNYTGERLTSITDTKGDRISLTYAGNLVTKITDADGRSVSYGYDGNLLTSSTDATGARTTYTYNAGNVMASVTDPRGGTTRFSYDGQNRLVSMTWADSTAAKPVITRYEYGSSGRSVQMTDPKGAGDWFWQFDDLGRIEEYLEPRWGVPATYAHNAFNSVTDYTNGTGGVSTLEYDGYNVLSITNNTDGARSEFTYGDVDNPNGPDSFTDPRGVVLNYDYDDREQMTSVTSDNDGADSVTAMVYRSPSQSCSGEIASSKDGNGNTTSYAYDSRCRLTQIARPGPVGNTVMTYDGFDRVRSVRDGEGRRQSITYDRNDRVTEVVYQDPGQGVAVAARTSYTYDANGNRLTRVDVNGKESQRSSWELDARNRVLVEDLPEVSNTYTYDVAGNMATHDGPWGLTSYTYDAANDVKTLTPPVGEPIAFGYYETTYAAVQFPNDTVDAQHYDLDGRIETIDQYRYVRGTGGSYTQFHRWEHDYEDPDTGSDTNSIYRITDSGHPGEGYQRDYTYDTAGRIKTAYGESNGDIFEDHSYTYDNNSNRTAWSRYGGEHTARYDAANRMTSMTDSTGAVVHYGYDGAGNLTSDSRGTQIAYDAKSSTESIKWRNMNAHNETDYNGTSQVERTSYGQTTFTNSLLGVTSSTNADGTTYYYRAPDGRVLGQYDPDGRAFYYLTDRQGSVTGVTSTDSEGNRNGSLVVSYGYGPYGEYLFGSDGGVGQVRPHVPFKYTGQWQDGTSVTGDGFYKIGLRYYDPQIGRWTQTDPLERITNPGQPSEAMPYNYTGCNPTNMTDPTGAMPPESEFNVWCYFGAISFVAAAPTLVAASGVGAVAGGISGAFGLASLGGCSTSLEWAMWYQSQLGTT